MRDCEGWEFVMYEFEAHYMRQHGGTIEKTRRMTETQFLEWVRTKGVKVWFFDVFRFEKGGAE